MACNRDINWEQRSYWKLGPNFGLDIKNPQLGGDGTDVYSFYATTDNKDQHTFGLTNSSGTFHIYNDRSIEIIAGQNNVGGGIDIVIAGKNGDVTITAERNGSIRIRGKNITIDADENVNITAGKNVNIKAGSRVVTQSPQADIVAKTGNAAPKGTSTGEQIYKNPKLGKDIVETAFNGGDTKQYTGGDDLLSDENTQLTGNETARAFDTGGPASGGALAEI